MVEPGAPGQIPKGKGKPKQQGVPKNQGVPKGKGVPKEQGTPPDQAVLPGTPGKKTPGEPGQTLPGTPGQLGKHDPNPWAPKEDTVVHEADLVVPPSRPLPEADEP